jgi:TPR repeat protein
MEKAAAMGFSPALFHLGYIYQHGLDVPIDLQKAYKYHSAAATHGHIFAQRQILERYLRGEYGFWGRITGFFSMLRLLWQTFSLYRKDPSDIRLMGFCQ